MQKDLIEFIAKSLVDDPTSVEVRQIEGENSVVIELKVGHDDIGRVIGKQGRIAKAMRTLLSVATGKSPKRYTLEIIE